MISIVRYVKNKGAQVMPAPAVLLALAARLGIKRAAKIVEKYGIPRLKAKINTVLKTKRDNSEGIRKNTSTKEKYDKMYKRVDKYKKDLKATGKNSGIKTDLGIKKGK